MNIFAFLTSLLTLFSLVGCENTQKNTYLLPEESALVKVELGDENSYTYAKINFGKETYGSVRYSWEDSTDFLEASPPGLNLSKLIVEKNNLETGFTGFIQERIFEQGEDNELILVGIRTQDDLFWIKNSDSNIYGLTYLSNNVLDVDGILSGNATLEKCTFGCITVGNINWETSFLAKYESPDFVDTPYGKFEYIEVLVTGTIDVTQLETEDASFNYNFREYLSFYPPIGVVRRILDYSGFDTLEVYMEINQTNITVPTNLIEQPDEPKT